MLGWLPSMGPYLRLPLTVQQSLHTEMLYTAVKVSCLIHFGTVGWQREKSYKARDSRLPTHREALLLGTALWVLHFTPGITNLKEKREFM